MKNFFLFFIIGFSAYPAFGWGSYSTYNPVKELLEIEGNLFDESSNLTQNGKDIILKLQKVAKIARIYKATEVCDNLPDSSLSTEGIKVIKNRFIHFSNVHKESNYKKYPEEILLLKYLTEFPSREECQKNKKLIEEKINELKSTVESELIATKVTIDEKQSAS